MRPSARRGLGAIGIAGAALIAPILQTRSSAQVPAVSPLAPTPPPVAAVAPAGGAVGAAGAAGAAGPAAPKSLWGFLGITKANCQACKEALCQTQLGQLMNNATGPANALAGGFVPALCPPAVPPTPAQLAAMNSLDQTGATAAAAEIKAQEAAAKARVLAVEYLGTVDCRYWPKARTALIAALRADPNECVRFAAARALNNGCCCNKDTIKALQISVAGDDSDGSPPELSPRVRGESFAALQNCLVRIPPVISVEPVKPEGPAVRPEGPVPAVPPVRPEAGAGTPGTPTHIAAQYLSVAPPIPPKFEEMLSRKTFAQVVEEARYTLSKAAEQNQSPKSMVTGKRSLFHALAKARQDVAGSRNDVVTQQVAPGDPALQPAAYVPETKPAMVPQDSMVDAATATSDSAPRRSRSLFGLFSR